MNPDQKQPVEGTAGRPELPDGSAHVSDGTLMQLIDGEHDLLPEGAIVHVDSCSHCRSRQQELASLSTAFRSMSGSITDTVDPAHIMPHNRGAGTRPLIAPMRTPSSRFKSVNRRVQRPDRAKRRVARRAWTVVATLAVGAVAAAASPAGPWVVAKVAALLGRVESTPTREVAIPRQAEPDQPTQANTRNISFDAEGAQLSVRLSQRPSSGALVIRATARATVNATVLGDSATTLTVLPGELRIVHGRRPLEISLDVGSSVRTVVVRVGETILATVAVRRGESQIVRLR
jgi:hypothetical protein